MRGAHGPEEGGYRLAAGGLQGAHGRRGARLPAEVSPTRGPSVKGGVLTGALEDLSLQ